jgi:hypothetical protein
MSRIRLSIRIKAKRWIRIRIKVKSYIRIRFKVMRICYTEVLALASTAGMCSTVKVFGMYKTLRHIYIRRSLELDVAFISSRGLDFFYYIMSFHK